MDIDFLVSLARTYSIDTVHPGYGFLSESADFAWRMWDEAQVVVIGPGREILAQTSDKLQARQLAMECGVPVLKAITSPTSNVNEIQAFASDAGYPVMIKAVDGGGGRGIRQVNNENEVAEAVNRAVRESPSQAVFVEKAAVNGYHHVEVQIVGDGTGSVQHLWERDCSVQRRFQKLIEVAPANIRNRKLLCAVIDSALGIARRIRYRSLGTFEYLVSEEREEFFFLEINPRLQVEHTVTESILGVDLVQMQLLLSQGASLDDLGLGTLPDPEIPPNSHSIQLRICAEDPRDNFALSIGTIKDFTLPTGHGVRVDTGNPLAVGTEFDNLLAKLIVTAPTWEATVLKAQRALTDTNIGGVKTNISLLRAIVLHPDFLAGKIDTRWLESNLDQLISLSQSFYAHDLPLAGPRRERDSIQLSTVSSSSALLLRKGDAWSITLKPLDDGPVQEQIQHHLRLKRVLRNGFPTSMAAEIEYTTPNAPRSAIPYKIQLEATAASASISMSSTYRRGDPGNPRHIVLPLSGKLVELNVSPGEDVVEGQVLAFVKQMKMELEVRSPRSGRVKWVLEPDETDADLAEGVLLVELDERGASNSDGGQLGFKGKL
ncbi:hypothetical protein ASPZODRAFT_129257 [Penicilliopsis zonata CBS 506.65]|uniref:Pyruvate carboxylase n=1 Tax=Penicilliopsis zonata CBS 506.65 TaxID=1073090 RepID=A0A1L9SNT8_9EURO|nr:hypothetical protein ASPZODRAFT_129257 [Penicilliopsis zonata CBS 506.65]OJJ48929.1 hypothetical protein ASPZODRAFT_129257 [Penicilliopsis zonata CBS 506.65]